MAFFISTLKKPTVFIPLCISSILAICIALFLTYGQSARSVSGTCVIVGNPASSRCVFLEYAQTQQEQQRGLGGRESMAIDRGMLFMFDSDDAHCMWMKDMRFGLDIVWLDSNKKVVTVRKNILPNTFPKSFCATQSSRYVIEVQAGVSEWRIGDEIVF